MLILVAFNFPSAFWISHWVIIVKLTNCGTTCAVPLRYRGLFSQIHENDSWRMLTTFRICYKYQFSSHVPGLVGSYNNDVFHSFSFYFFYLFFNQTTVLVVVLFLSNMKFFCFKLWITITSDLWGGILEEMIRLFYSMMIFF